MSRKAVQALQVEPPLLMCFREVIRVHVRALAKHLDEPFIRKLRINEVSEKPGPTTVCAEAH